MRGSAPGFIIARFMAGRREASGERDLAGKALRGAVFSVAVSLVPLVTVMQVSDGMIEGITARYVELGTYHAQAHAYATAVDVDAAAESIRAAPGIAGVWKETQSVGVAFANGRREGTPVRGVEQGFLDDPGSRAFLEVLEGEAVLDKPNDAVLGVELADKLGVSVGETLNLITVRKTRDGQDAPRITILSVRGIVSAGYRELDAQWLLVRQDTLERIAPREGSRSFLGVKASDPFGRPELAADLARDALPTGFAVYSWRDLERNLFESLASTRTMLLIIMAVTVAVASVNISSALTTLVLERGQEVAVLKGLGARPGDQSAMFSLGGAALGMAGGVLGAAGGLLVSLRINEILRGLETIAFRFRGLAAWLAGKPAPKVAAAILDPAYYLERIPVDVRFDEVAIVVACTMLLSFAASLLPARRAARLSPLDMLRRH